MRRARRLSDGDVRAGIACVVPSTCWTGTSTRRPLASQARDASAHFEKTVRLCSYEGCDGERGRRVEQVLRNGARGRRARD